MQSGDVNQLIEEIITHEVNLEKMYQQFAKSHPNYRQFWSQLAREEAMHVKWIKSLARYYENGQINLSNFNLAPQAVKTSTSNLEKQTEASKNGHFSLLNAVSIALDIEKSMIENKFFAIFEMEDAKCARIRAGLEKETYKHRRQLEALYLKLCQN